MRSSMTLRARASRPTSVAWSAPGTRWSRSPAAMESAVRSTSSSGRKPEPDQPPPAGQSEDEGARRDGQLGEEERVQGAVLVDQRQRLHLHEVAGDLLRAHPEAGSTGGHGSGGEVRDLRPVWLRPESGDGYGQLGSGRMAVDVGGAAGRDRCARGLDCVDHGGLLGVHHGEIAHGEDVGKSAGARRGTRAAIPAIPAVPGVAAVPAVAGDGVGATVDRVRLWQATLEHQAFLCPEKVAAVLGQLLVDLVVQGGAQSRVGREVGHHECDEGDRSDGEEESEPK